MKGPVKTYMSGDPVTTSPGASALEALGAMLDRGIRHLPVIDGHGHVVGVLSIDDVRAALPHPVGLRQSPADAQRTAALELSVGEIMTHDPATLGEEATLAEAAECMAERRIGCVPIVDENGELAGLLSETDVLWAVATAGGAHRKRRAEN